MYSRLAFLLLGLAGVLLTALPESLALRTIGATIAVSTLAITAFRSGPSQTVFTEADWEQLAEGWQLTLAFRRHGIWNPGAIEVYKRSGGEVRHVSVATAINGRNVKIEANSAFAGEARIS